METWKMWYFLQNVTGRFHNFFRNRWYRALLKQTGQRAF